MSTPQIIIKMNIAGTHDGPSDEARYGEIYIDEKSGDAKIDIYLPKSGDGDNAQVDLDAIERLVPAD